VRRGCMQDDVRDELRLRERRVLQWRGVLTADRTGRTVHDERALRDRLRLRRRSLLQQRVQRPMRSVQRDGHGRHVRAGRCAVELARGLPDGDGDDPCAQAQCDGISGTTCNGFAGPSVACGTASCVDGGAQPAGSCDGAGACKLPPVSSCGNFACEGTTCVKTCASTSDCALGNTCTTGGVCVSGATCDGNHTVTGANGATTDCSPYKCTQGSSQGAAASCLQKCNSIADCFSPDVCNASGQCVAAPTSPSSSSGVDVAPLRWARALEVRQRRSSCSRAPRGGGGDANPAGW